MGQVLGLPPAGVGAGSGVEEGGGRGDEAFGAGAVDTEIAGEAEVGEGVPLWSAPLVVAAVGSFARNRLTVAASPRMAAV
jgi:hypothetical protein